MTKEHYYEVNLKWTEGRMGEVSSPVLNEKIACATPPEFQGGVPGIWSPEHLYAAAINSCFMTTFLAIAENSKLSFTNYSCKTVCKLEMSDGKFMITEAVISPALTLSNIDADSEKAQRVLDKSKAACLITNSIKTSITLQSTIM